MRSRSPWGFLVAGLFLLSPAPAFAYDHEVHYAWTYYLALHAGYTKRQAFQIGSAAYSVDEDAETNPLENSGLGDGILGAERLPTVNKKVTRIWRDFHCFERAGQSAQEARDARQTREGELWDLAKKQRNPGILLHYLQDSYSHHGYDDTRGHFAAGHTPDFLSHDRIASVNMTARTLSVLQDFRVGVLNQPKPTRPLDFGRILKVLDRLIAAHPASFLGRPDLAKVIAIVNQAVKEDEQSGRLDTFPPVGAWDPLWGLDELPPRWQQFDNDAAGNVTDPAYGVELPTLTVGAAQVLSRAPLAADPRRIEVRVRVPYTLKGAAPLLYIHYAGELPVLELAKIPGAPVGAAQRRTRRVDGDHAMEFTVVVPAEALAAGATWSFSAAAPGVESRSVDLALSAAPTPGRAGGRLQFKKMSPEDAARMAKAVGGGAGAGSAAKPPPAKPGAPPAPPPTAGAGIPAQQPWAATHYDQGREAMLRRDFAGAEAAFREAIRLSGGHPRYHYALAAALVGQKRAKEAEAAARAAVKLDPKDGRNHHTVGMALLLQERWPEAEAAYKEAIRLTPDIGHYHAQLAIVLHRQGRGPDAQAAGREAMRLGYHHEGIYREIGLLSQ
jgi:tetratricopeptide (TPR) repeat protein